jgi:hypothetical protein
LREGALLEREAREHQAELQAQAQEAAQQKKLSCSLRPSEVS